MDIALHNGRPLWLKRPLRGKQPRDARNASLGFGCPSTKVPPIRDIQNKDSFVHIKRILCTQEGFFCSNSVVFHEGVRLSGRHILVARRELFAVMGIHNQCNMWSQEATIYTIFYLI